MKNILGTTENLELFDNEGRKVYNFYKYSKEYSYECTYDLNGKILTYKDSEEISYEYTYDLNGKILTYKDSEEFSYEYTYDLNGKELTFKNSNGYSHEYTYDLNGKELTFKNSDEQMRGFNIPEYTMEELVEKLGNFKIKK
jgi:YD repeat-containing protein